MGEIIAVKNLKTFADEVAQQGERLVLTNGCFDLLHVGHVRYLQSAKNLGDVLLVAVNSDASVRALKGPDRPIKNQEERAEIVSALGCVNYVVIFDSLRVAQVIRDVRPAFYAKGGDYTREALDLEEITALKEVKAEIRILPHVPGCSTTDLVHHLSDIQRRNS